MSVDDDDDDGLVVSEEYQCDGDGDDDNDGDDDAKICWFHVMVMVIGKKTTNLVVSEEMVQYNKICCFIGYIFVIAYICGNIL